MDFRLSNALHNNSVGRLPIPRITELLSLLGDCLFFFTEDLESDFWQIPLGAEDREKTVFNTAKGHYGFNVMAFGLRNAPCGICQCISTVLEKFLGIHALACTSII